MKIIVRSRDNAVDMVSCDRVEIVGREYGDATLVAVTDNVVEHAWCIDRLNYMRIEKED